ncbi:unnamed protein product [Pleuronectes platessa]|uniref:Uncharacterized protein n=1 Tax=Pleuronectes platessa TaxID=8262 RepID=A0A9N7Y5L2_PLEPL|nr:unnamed protein product [Pleuronectes platessa]
MANVTLFPALSFFKSRRCCPEAANQALPCWDSPANRSARKTFMVGSEEVETMEPASETSGNSNMRKKKKKKRPCWFSLQLRVWCFCFGPGGGFLQTGGCMCVARSLTSNPPVLLTAPGVFYFGKLALAVHGGLAMTHYSFFHAPVRFRGRCPVFSR